MEVCVLGSGVAVLYWHFCYTNTTWTHSFRVAWSTSEGIKLGCYKNKQVSASMLHKQIGMSGLQYTECTQTMLTFTCI